MVGHDAVPTRPPPFPVAGPASEVPKWCACSPRCIGRVALDIGRRGSAGKTMLSAPMASPKSGRMLAFLLFNGSIWRAPAQRPHGLPRPQAGVSRGAGRHHRRAGGLEVATMLRRPMLRRIAYLRRNRCSALMVALFVFILVHPLFAESAIGGTFLVLGMVG